LGFAAWRRSEYRSSIGFLELTRVLLLALAAVVLNQPEWIEEYHPTEKPTVAVMWDDSASMETRDVVPTGKASGQPMTRRESIAPLTSEWAWQALTKKYKVVVVPFSRAKGGHGTILYAPLAEAPEKFKTLPGIVLASDGDWNEGQPPVLAATQL